MPPDWAEASQPNCNKSARNSGPATSFAAFTAANQPRRRSLRSGKFLASRPTPNGTYCTCPLSLTDDRHQLSP